MKAHDTEIKRYLEGSKQFAVPLFQRTYSWEKNHIERMWDDIEETRQSDDDHPHFFGSFVTMPFTSSASRVDEYSIIDGQQRLTTIQILLAVLRNKIRDLKQDSKTVNEIENLYLINRYHPERKYKIMPTQADRDVFFSIIDDSPPSLVEGHRMTQAYRFLEEKLSEFGKVEELESIKDTLLHDFLIVDICLESDDDAYLIFESLNATGTPLTQADLVRNYLFMRLEQETQQNVYDQIWLPMQNSLSTQLEPFFRHYLAMNGDIPNIRRIYSTFRETTDSEAKSSEEVIEKMKDIHKFSRYYYVFMNPEKETETTLRKYLQKFRRLSMTTAFPLFLKLYDEYDNSALSLDDFAACLRYVEIFYTRRAVCGIPTNVLNKYFPIVCSSIEKSDIVGSLKLTLSSGKGTREMPDDEEFKQCLEIRRLFGNRILRFVLEEIERYGNKEVVDFGSLQVEHIMPQTLSDEWKEALGDNWETVHQKYLDTIGNLTLTGYNPEYSNKLFGEKRDMKKGFRESNLQLNRDLVGLEKWTENEIRERAKNLTEIGMKIWRFTV